jgi:hypothetical protein
MGKPMNEQTASRWDAFTPWELQALDEFFQSFGPLRDYSGDIGRLGDEITAAMQRRDIPPFSSPEPLAAKVKAPPGPAL